MHNIIYVYVLLGLY